MSTTTTSITTPVRARATSELERIVDALRAGDAAFVVTLVERYGSPIGRELRRLGVDDDDVGRLVHDVAFALLDGVVTDVAATAWDRVVEACGRVVAGAGRVDDGPIDLLANAAVARSGRRTLHLVDIENLSGGPHRAGHWFVPSLHQLAAASNVEADDLIVMAADVGLYRQTMHLVRGCRYRPGYGADGADAVLLDAAPPRWVIGRFERLVIASGDHAFAPLARAVRSGGVSVEVVSRPAQLSAQLRATTDHVHLLPDLPTVSVDAMTHVTAA